MSEQSMEPISMGKVSFFQQKHVLEPTWKGVLGWVKECDSGQILSGMDRPGAKV